MFFQYIHKNSTSQAATNLDFMETMEVVPRWWSPCFFFSVIIVVLEKKKLWTDKKVAFNDQAPTNIVTEKSNIDLFKDDDEGSDKEEDEEEDEKGTIYFS